MNICLQTVLQFTFSLLEIRYGQSRVQRYEALVLGRLTGLHVNWYWPLTLLSLIALPLVLSIAYTKFLGGTTSAPFAPPDIGQYGINFPKIGDWSLPNNPLYVLTVSMGIF